MIKHFMPVKIVELDGHTPSLTLANEDCRQMVDRMKRFDWPALMVGGSTDQT